MKMKIQNIKKKIDLISVIYWKMGMSKCIGSKIMIKLAGHDIVYLFR